MIVIDPNNVRGAVTVLQTSSSNPTINCGFTSATASLELVKEVLQSVPTEILAKIKALEQYQLPAGVIERLKQKHPFSLMVDQELDTWLTEFKKFIAILILNNGRNWRIEMVNEIVDEVWHTFILFTKEYADFCNQVMGKYIHHEPNTDALVPTFAVTPMSPIMGRNEQEIGIQNFSEDYKKYFGQLPSDRIWDKKLDPMVADSVVKSIEQRKDRMISILSVGILLTVDAMLALALIRSYILENANVLDYIIPTALGTLAVAVLFYLLARKHEAVKEMIVVGYLFVLVTILVLGLAFLVMCKMPGDAKSGLGFPAGFSAFIATVVMLMFINNKVKRGSIYRESSSKKRAAGGGCGAGAACGSGAGGGGDVADVSDIIRIQHLVLVT